MAKSTKNKQPNWYRLSEERLIIENQKLLTKTRDRLRKYNAKYGTNYVLNIPNINLKDPNLHIKLNAITTANIKAGMLDDLKNRYDVNGVELNREQVEEMKKLEAKANRLRGKREDGTNYYTANFKSIKGYERYMDVLRKVSTREGYLMGIKRGLQTFKANVLNHLDDLISACKDKDKLDELNELYNWFNEVVNTYSRLERVYKLFKKYGYTGEQMARIFFDSDPTRSQFMAGEDELFIKLLKLAKTGEANIAGIDVKVKGYAWKNKQKLTQLELDYPIDL